MYEDFEDLRERCPSEIQADIAVDFLHDDPARLAELWAGTEDGEFRLSLGQRASDFWEEAVRARGDGKIAEDHFAIEILMDSYHDPEMGYSMYLELHAYCGSEQVGEICWDAFDDGALESDFCARLARQAADLFGQVVPNSGVRCEVEITEVQEV